MPKTSHSSVAAITGLWNLAVTTFVIATLYFGREVLVPLALAILFAFLLAPLVGVIERRIGRIAAVVLTTLLIFMAIGGIAWILSHQFVDLAGKLPEYRQTIAAKLQALHLPVAQPSAQLPAASTHGSQDSVPSDILHPSPTALAQMLIASLLSPLGNAALVALLVIFILINREDLRSRFIRIVGQGRISVTTRAMDDASSRVARYLLLLFVVNLSFGVIIAGGLALIGLPNAILWGSLAAILRFIPYIGCWIAAALPVALSVAVSASWTTPLLVFGLFVVVELINANVLEPWLYGTHTGVAPFALIVAAIFWAWLWGPIGLLLSTPLTVCLVVMGRHVPSLDFLSVMLSDEEALTPAEECYRRLLSVGLNEASELVDAFLKTHSSTELFDSVLVPVIVLAEIDRRRETLEEEQLALVDQGVSDLVEDLGARSIVPNVNSSDEESTMRGDSRPRIYCVPARASRDDLAGKMLAQLLCENGYTANASSADPRDIDRLMVTARDAQPDIVCVTVVSPSTVIHARFLCRKLTDQSPGLKIVVTLWGGVTNLAEASERLYTSGATLVATTLEESVKRVGELAGAWPPESGKGSESGREVRI